MDMDVRTGQYMSGNLTDVREMSGISPKVRKMSGNFTVPGDGHADHKSHRIIKQPESVEHVRTDEP